MKFQNPSFKIFLNERTDARTSRKQYAPRFFKVGGIKNGHRNIFMTKSSQKKVQEVAIDLGSPSGIATELKRLVM